MKSNAILSSNGAHALSDVALTGSGGTGSGGSPLKKVPSSLHGWAANINQRVYIEFFQQIMNTPFK